MLHAGLTEPFQHIGKRNECCTQDERNEVDDEINVAEAAGESVGVGRRLRPV